MLAELPNRSLFKAPEVCEIAQLQPYVLRSWEAEFPDLGVTRAGSSGRVYRRGDVERVLRLKHLLFVEGLTLAGARRRLEEERATLPSVEELASEVAATQTASSAAAADKRHGALRRQLGAVQQGLRALLEMLEKNGGKAQQPFELHAATAAPRAKRKTEGRHVKAKSHKAEGRRRR